VDSLCDLDSGRTDRRVSNPGGIFTWPPFDPIRERELWGEFATYVPGIIGALFGAVSTALKYKDARFLVADLTDRCPGAYWEAGFAHGLGKPVIYMCELKTFEDEGWPRC
jgi:hypothetical protein